MMLRMRLRDSSLCEGSDDRVNLPVIFGMFGSNVVFASIPRIVVRVSWDSPIHWCIFHTYRDNRLCRHFW